MKRMVMFGSLLLAVTTIAHAQSTQTVRVNLTLGSNEVLVGEPTSLAIDVDNRSDSTVTLPRTAMIQFTDSGGTFLARSYDGTGPGTFTLDEEYSDTDLTVGPQRHSTFYVPVAEDTVTSPVMHPRLNKAGTYAVTVALVAGPSGDLRQVTEFSDLPATAQPVYTSNTVSLKVDDPAGADADVWNLIASRSNGGGWNALDSAGRMAIAQTIRSNYPSSRYALTFGTLLPPDASSDQRKAILAMLEERSPKGPIVDWFRLFDAGLHLKRQSEFLLKDLSVSLDEVDKISAAFNDLAQNATNDLVRRRARRELNTYPQSKNSVIAAAADLAAARSQQHAVLVIPFAQCVRGTGEGRKIVFGYFNPSTNTIVQPVGPNNEFQPPPVDQGQPSEFLPGQHLNSFEVRYKEKTAGYGGLQWLVDGSIASVPDDLQQCEGNDWH